MINYALSPLIDNLTMMTSSKWKINVIFLVENCLSYNISKFGLNWTNGLSDTKQNEDLTFDLHLHNQDGLIWTWCFYVIWLSGHTPYAHEIWAIYDEWLWRYEWSCENTKWRLDDVMVGWSGWKGYCIHSSSGQRYCENLKMIAHSVFEIS